jgi:hypothetical protein
MSFFNRKKKNQDKIKITTLSPKSQIRKIIYDSGCKNPEQVAVLMGLGSLSEDVAEMEEAASDKRLDRLVPIMPVLETSAMVAAQVNATAFIQGEIEDGEEMPEEALITALTQMFRVVSYSSIVSCMSTLIDLGLLKEGYNNGE